MDVHLYEIHFCYLKYESIMFMNLSLSSLYILLHHPLEILKLQNIFKRFYLTLHAWWCLMFDYLTSFYCVIRTDEVHMIHDLIKKVVHIKDYITHHMTYCCTLYSCLWANSIDVVCNCSILYNAIHKTCIINI